MPPVRDVVFKFRWFILAGCSLVFFLLIGFVVLGLLIPEPLPEAEHAELLSKPTGTLDKLATITPTKNIIPTSTPLPKENESEFPTKEIAYVERIIDGDSIEVMLDGSLTSLRYIGLDAPEIGKPYSLEAADFNRDLVEGQIVELERDVSNRDKYGRLLRYVYLQDGTMVNIELVRLGFALASAYPPDTKYQHLINSSENEAKQGGIGVWAPASPTSTAIDRDLSINIQVEPSCSQFNSPGNDNENKNEEYVCISNSGSGAVDLSGWSLKDEYGWTYYFPEFFLSAGSRVRIRTGCGADTEQDLFWCKDETAVWNNDGDCVFIIDPLEKMVADYCY